MTLEIIDHGYHYLPYECLLRMGRFQYYNQVITQEKDSH